MEKIKDKLIVMFYQESVDKLLDISLYEFVANQYKKENRTAVCHITYEEYETMKEQIENGGLKERTVEDGPIGYNPCRYLMLYDDDKSIFYISNYNKKYVKGSYTVGKNGLVFEKKEKQFVNIPELADYLECADRVYTTETFSDVMTYYKNMDKKVVLYASNKWQKRYLKAADKIEKITNPKELSKEDLEEIKLLFRKIVED